MSAAAIGPRVGDLRQLASVRRIVLDDGAERGVRALAFSTGGGLDFWVLTDRSFDIGPLWFRGLPVAWQSPNGFRSPALHDSTADGGQGFRRSLSGFLVTCGLEHVRQPDGGRPLHGGLPLTPGRLAGYGEDWRGRAPYLWCQGEVTQARPDGEMLRLHRRIEAPVGGTTLAIHDEVENIGAEAQAHQILYHLNLGFPAIGARSGIHIDGAVMPVAGEGAEPTVTCRRLDPDGPGRCDVVTPLGPAFGTLAVSVVQTTATLPFLQLWQDPRPRRYILGIEPCTSDRLPDGRSAPSEPLAAGASRRYDVEVTLGLRPATALGQQA